MKQTLSTGLKGNKITARFVLQANTFFNRLPEDVPSGYSQETGGGLRTTSCGSTSENLFAVRHLL
jgi:hypothetical protein